MLRISPRRNPQSTRGKTKPETISKKGTKQEAEFYNFLIDIFIFYKIL